MNKTGSTIELFDELQKELRLLRKGSGLALWKLDSASLLRQMIARRLDIPQTELASTQLYGYLLHEINELTGSELKRALKCAYALEESTASSLTRRRADLSLQMERHPDTLKAYENQAIDELAHRLMESPSLPPPAPIAISTDKPLEQALQRTVVEGLGGLYELGTHASEVLRVFGKSRQPYLDARVECSLLPSKRGSDWYVYRYRYTFRSLKTTFRIGVVTSTQDSSILMATGLFDEMIQLNEGADFERELPGIIGNCRFVVRDMETDSHQSLWFAEVDAPRRRELLGSVWQIDADTCRVIELQIPVAEQTVSTLYELRVDYDLRVDEHYAYWGTPGLMYLTTLTIDISQFPRRDTWQFFLKPFLGTTFTGSFDPGGNRFSLPANNWITAGQGVVLIWQEKQPS